MFLWILALGFSSACGADLPDITDRSFIHLCLREHNRARAEVRPPATDMRFMSCKTTKDVVSIGLSQCIPVAPNEVKLETTELVLWHEDQTGTDQLVQAQSWDAGLAVIARSWARRCVFEHSPSQPSQHPGFPSLGENLWVGTHPSRFSVPHAIGRWVNETVDYSYNRNHCRERQMCGHYTQVVWARSYKVGCAVHLCSSGIRGTSFQSQPGANFVCNYGPAGNVIGQRPYQTAGDACSKCDPEDTCEDRLCRNNSRDAEKSKMLSAIVEGNNSRDAEKSSGSKSSASDFVPVLVIRPVAVLGSVIAAIAVKHFYPDIFCYE